MYLLHEGNYNNIPNKEEEREYCKDAKSNVKMNVWG